MAVLKRKNSPFYYVQFVSRGVRVRESTGTTTKSAAEAYERQRRGELYNEVAILTYACDGEIDKPLAFPLADVQRLVMHGLIVLATFDDDTAEEIILKHYPHLIDGRDIL